MNKALNKVKAGTKAEERDGELHCPYCDKRLTDLDEYFWMGASELSEVNCKHCRKKLTVRVDVTHVFSCYAGHRKGNLYYGG